MEIQISVSAAKKHGLLVEDIDFAMSDNEKEIREAAEELGPFLDIMNVQNGPAGYLTADVLFKDKKQATAWLNKYEPDDKDFAKEALKFSKKI